MSKKRRVQEEFSGARTVDPTGISGRESSRTLLATAFPAFVGRQVRIAYELMERSLAQDSAVFLTLSGAMTPAGLHQSCLIPLIRSGAVSCLTTTGANLYHDAHRVLGHGVRELSPEASDLQLRLARIIRIYDLGFWESALLDTDRLFSALLQKDRFQRKMTTPELHYELGREMASLERALKVKQPSLLSTCFKAGVPIFVGAVQDGSIFLNIVKLQRLLGASFKLEIDVAADVFAMAAMQRYVRHKLGKPLAIWILGGGVPKNYTLQGEPLLGQIFNIPADGFDIDVQFCVDPVDNGALSSCPAGEGHTWGKVSADCVASSSVYVHTDLTAVFPWLTHALLANRQLKRKPQRLHDHFHDAQAALDVEVARRKVSLLRTLRMPESAQRTRKGKGTSSGRSSTPRTRAR